MIWRYPHFRKPPYAPGILTLIFVCKLSKIAHDVSTRPPSHHDVEVDHDSFAQIYPCKCALPEAWVTGRAAWTQLEAGINNKYMDYITNHKGDMIWLVVWFNCDYDPANNILGKIASKLQVRRMILIVNGSWISRIRCKRRKIKWLITDVEQMPLQPPEAKWRRVGRKLPVPVAHKN